MITHANISHYKSIAEASISFSSMNVFVGQNGVGKSNIIDALCFLHDCVVDDLDTAVLKRHGIESLRQWSKTRPFHMSIEVYLKSRRGVGSYRAVLSSSRGTYKVMEEKGFWFGRSPFPQREANSPQLPIRTEFSRHENGITNITNSDESSKDMSLEISSTDLFLTVLAGPAFSVLSMQLSPIVDCLRSFSAYSIYPNTLREPRAVSSRERLLSDGSNMASIIKKINSGKRTNKEAIVESLKIIMPTLVDISIKSAGGYYVPVISVEEQNGEVHQFNMSQLSDGTLKVLGILTAFHQPNAPDVIALEEPEQMVHPGVLPVIASAMEEYIADHPFGGQVFITTHSPAMLDLVPAKSIIWVSSENGITKCGPINDRQLEVIKKKLFSAGELLMSEGFLSE